MGVPTAALTLPALDIVIALAKGSSFASALRATYWGDEDLEMLPFLVIGAVMLGALVAVVAAAAWHLAVSRRPGRPLLARCSAALAAAFVPVLLLVLPNWPFAVAIAIPAAALAAVGAPVIGYKRPDETEAGHVLAQT